MTTLPGFVARVRRRPVEPPPKGPVRDSFRKFFLRHLRGDWTVGCVAVTDAAIRAIRSLVPAGVRIAIHP